MTARKGVLAGTTSVDNWPPQAGWGRFQVANSRGGDLLDGVVSWSSSKETKVDWSRYIWVRKTPDNAELLDFAKKEMNLELQMLKARRAKK